MEGKKIFVNKWLLFPIFKRLLLIKRIILILSVNYSIAYIQRAFLQRRLVNILKLKNTKIIFDFDDAIYLNTKKQKNNEKKTLAMLSVSDWITVASPVLANYCKSHGYNNVSLITTPVETNRIRVIDKDNRTKTVIGWIGSPFTSKYLKEIEPALVAVYNKYNITLLFVGCNKEFNFKGIEIEKELWKYESEPELLGRMDIGIMPLNTDEYSKGKGGYKIFQYMAAGLPVIASPVGINDEIVLNNITGFLAHSTEEWIKYLSYLIENPFERMRMGNYGRKLAEEKYSIDYCSSLLVNIIKKLEV